MKEKERFIALAQTGRFTIKALCKDFGIRQKTGYKYLKRYKREGRAGLVERSRRQKHCPWSTDSEIQALILKEDKGKDKGTGLLHPVYAAPAGAPSIEGSLVPH